MLYYEMWRMISSAGKYGRGHTLVPIMFGFAHRNKYLKIYQSCQFCQELLQAKVSSPSLCGNKLGTSANWFDEIMTYHDMSPKVTMLN